MNGTTKTAKKKAPEGSKGRTSVKDVIIGLILLAFLGLIVYSRLSGLAPGEWTGEITGIVGDFTIYLLGIIGVFEFCYDNGITIFVPDKFADHKEQRLREQTKEYLYDFFDRESKFLSEHEEGRLADALCMMGLSAPEYQYIQSKVLEARLAPVSDLETARQKILDIMFYSDVVVDMHRNAACMNAGDLRYYFRFHDLMHSNSQSEAISAAMATFISKTCMKEGINLAEIDVIMVPHSSNYLLGLTVSRQLNKHFIKMIPPEKRIGNFSFEGVIPDKITKKTVDVLIIHDVLLTGRQIYESADSLMAALPNCRIHGLFSAVYRSVKNGKEALEHSHSIKCYSLIELTEEEVELELKKRGKG